MSDTPGTMNGIGWAVKHLRNGDSVRRAGWNDKGMSLFLEPADDGRYIGYEALPYVAMVTADGKVVPWLCSQTDLLAEDWELVDA